MFRVCCWCFYRNRERIDENVTDNKERQMLLNDDYDVLPCNIEFIMQEDYKFLHKGEKVISINTVMNARRSEYLEVCMLGGGEPIEVPMNYLVEVIKIEHEPWYFGDIQDRQKAESVLMRADNVNGLFLVRPKKDEQNPYIISVKSLENEGEPVIKHYLIYKKDNWYGTENAEKYVTVRKMIQAYMEKSVAILTQPCPKVFALEIPREEIQLGDALGKGNFSVVLKGTWNQRTVAIKQILTDKENRNNFLVEANLMHQFRHENIVNLLGACITEDTCIIVLEYMSGGSLSTYLNRNELSLPSILKMLVQIVDAMSFLETYRVIHRDLAARNILKGDGDIVKLADFGLSRKLEISDYYVMSTENSALPILWLAPETVEVISRFTTKSDVWAFAILTMEMFTRARRPYTALECEIKEKLGHVSWPQKLFPTLREGQREPKPHTMPQEIYNMLLRCWNLDFTKRPTFRSMHQFFLEEYQNCDKPNYANE